jgi:hypothetical protein
MGRKEFAEQIGLVAVVAGLVFVGLEIRQNNRLAQAAAYLEVGQMTADNWFNQARDPEYNLLYRQSWVADDEWWAELSTETVARLASDLQGAIRHYETIYLLVELDVLDEAGLTRLGWGGFGDLPPVRRLWPCLYITSEEMRAHLTENWESVPAFGSPIEAFGACPGQNAP